MMSHVCRKNPFSKQIFFQRLIMSVITKTLYGHPAHDAQMRQYLRGHLNGNRACTHFLKSTEMIVEKMTQHYTIMSRRKNVTL